MKLDNALYNGEAKPVSFCSMGGIALIKLLKNMRGCLRWDFLTLIGNRNRCLPIYLRYLYFDYAMSGGEFNSVVY